MQPDNAFSAKGLADTHWIRYAVQWAAQVTERQVSPNPRVGAVVLDANGQLVGQGWHQQAGTPHAEAHALAAAGELAAGGTLYVTLEPCNHYGRMPPCTEAIIAAGIQRVVYGMRDPNPMVSGQGIDRLQQAGIAVDGPVETAPCEALNPVFCHHVVQQMPYTAVKVATTLDGYMADREGRSQWITGPATREDVHRQRSRFSALLTTAKTILADNSQLTVRVPAPDTTPPVRVVLDAHARLLFTDMPLAVFDTTHAPTTVVTTDLHLAAYQARHPQLNFITTRAGDNGTFSLTTLWQQLYQMGLTSVWAEAGPGLSSALLAEPAIVQQLWWYRSGQLLGHGTPAVNWHPGFGLAEASRWFPGRHQAFAGIDSLIVYERTALLHQLFCQQSV